MSNYFNILLWEYHFYKPYYLGFLLVIPLVFLTLRLWKKNHLGQLKYAGTANNQTAFSNSWVRFIRWGIRTFQGLALACVLIPLAHPYHESIDPPKIDYKNGIDIILSIDASGSMLAQDFDPNRLEVSKKLAQEFVDSRKGDRIGLVVYEGEAYTACPATLDYTLLKQQIAQIEPGFLEPGTAIGNGLGVAVSRLRSDELKSKVIILLTDGSNNAGSISPIEAAELAKAKNCKVYTIGVGGTGLAPTPVMTPFGISYQNMPVDIDEGVLKKIASMTGGKYFRAKDTRGLEKIYAEIDNMEKRKMEASQTGVQPPITIIPFFIWAIIFSVSAWFIQQWKFKLDD